MRISILDTESREKLPPVYPYHFLQSYALSVNDALNTVEVIFHAELNAYIAVQLTEIKFIKRAGLLTPPLREGKRLGAGEEKIFFDQLLVFFKKQGIHRVIPQNSFEVFYAHPGASTVAGIGHYETDLLQSEEALYAGLRYNYRRSVKQAVEKNVEVVFGAEQYATCLSLINETHQRQGQAMVNMKIMEAMKKNIPGNILFGVAYYEGKPYGSVVAPYTSYAGYYLHGGSAAEQPMDGIVKLLQWQLIRELKNRGAKKYLMGCFRLKNTEGTKFEGIQRFKQGFGAEMKHGFLWKSDTSVLRGKIFDTALKIKNKLKGETLNKDIIDSQLE